MKHTGETIIGVSVCRVLKLATLFPSLVRLQRRTPWRIVAILLVLHQLIVASGCGSAAKIQDTATIEKDEAAIERDDAAIEKDGVATRRRQDERRIAELAKKYGANTDWANAFSDKHRGKPYSFQRQEALDALVGHPMLAKVDIVDIARGKEGFRLICSFLDEYGWGGIYFVLDLPEKRARQLTHTHDPLATCEFVIVAVPSRVTVRFNRELFVEPAASIDDEPTASVGGPSGETWVMGKCLEVEKLAE